MTTTNKDKVKVILETGDVVSLEQWQRTYGLQEGSTRIGRFFYLTESRFQKDLEKFGELIVNAVLIRFLDALRAESGVPLYLNSFNRSSSYQKELKSRGLRAAETSPHEVVHHEDGVISGACAGDVDTLTEEGTRDLARKAKEVSKKTGIKVRLGFEQYLNEKPKQTFLHIDVCPMFYGPGQPWHPLPHPKVWEKTITW